MTAMLASAAANSPAKSPDTELLLGRAASYWAHVKDNRKLKAWEFEDQSIETPEALQAYMEKPNSLVVNSTLVEGVVKLEGDEAVLKVRLSTSMPLVYMKAYESILQDPWRRINGQWYHVRAKSNVTTGK